MFVESCIFDLRSRATQSEQMLNNTVQHGVVQHVCLAQFLLVSNHMEFDKDKNPFKIEFDSKFIWP